jgi:hypothetical protein
VPFLLKFSINTQLRYLNTRDSETCQPPRRDARRSLAQRDITVNRAMFILGVRV